MTYPTKYLIADTTNGVQEISPADYSGQALESDIADFYNRLSDLPDNTIIVVGLYAVLNSLERKYYTSIEEEFGITRVKYAGYNIEQRRRIVINTDPQRRCYNGAHASSETIWSEWQVIEVNVPGEKVGTRLEFWKWLNDYAVSQRGQGSRAEFRKIRTYEAIDERN